MKTLDLYYVITQFFIKLFSRGIPRNSPVAANFFSWHTQIDESDNYFARKIGNESLLLICDFFVYFCLAGESAVVLPSVCEQLQALNERVHTFAFDIVFIQIRQQLAQTPKLQVISSLSDVLFCIIIC